MLSMYGHERRFNANPLLLQIRHAGASASLRSRLYVVYGERLELLKLICLTRILDKTSVPYNYSPNWKHREAALCTGKSA